ncbi:hypothetical protein Dimus_033458 [Dionaea muscipula]
MACGNKVLISLLGLILVSLSPHIHGKLSPRYYCSSCPEALPIVKQVVIEAIKNDTRMGASLLRLHFHDCFVNGCDGSVLLDDNATFIGEKTAIPNNGSVRGFDVVDKIKAKLEAACPGVVSCADILAIAARDSVVYLGGPTWVVRLGRRDSVTANRTAANIFIPSPQLNLTGLTASFAVQGLSFNNMVSLSGAHTIGFSRCVSFRPHIYNDTDIDELFASFLRKKCPVRGNDDVLQGLDFQTPLYFDNDYYKNLLVKKGLLHSDQELYNSNAADHLVKRYVSKPYSFFKDFSKGIIRMGNIRPLTGSQGEVRLNCRKAN